jgi:vacuolar protein sorting-associated protein 13A/C
VYSPYVILNRTGMKLDIQSEGSKLFGSTTAAAGQRSFTDSENEPQKATPFMFSFPSDRRKPRAQLMIGDSQWSQPQSFDAIGSTYNVTVPSSSGRKEMNIGVNIEEGEGKVGDNIWIHIKPSTNQNTVQYDESCYYRSKVHCQEQTH